MKKIIFTMVALLTFAAFAGCGKQEEKTTVKYEVNNPLEAEGDSFIQVADGNEMELLLNPETGVIRWRNKNTGEYKDNKVLPDALSNATANSDVVARYFSGSKTNKLNQTSTMDTYNYGTCQEDAVQYEKLENGVRFVYTLGDDSITYKMFPKYISEERLQTLVLDYCDAKEQKSLKKQYTLIKSRGFYQRQTDEEHPLKGLAAKQLYSLFYEKGQYNKEELLADDQEYDEEFGSMADFPVDFNIGIVVDYVLEGDELVVRIPTENLTTIEDYPMNEIEVLPYFLASTSDNGYLFIPDGSGALINLDSTKKTDYQFVANYYNGDKVRDEIKYSSFNNELMMPVYGIKEDDHAIIGIIEKGSEIARLNTYVKGYYANVNYARASLTFTIRDGQQPYGTTSTALITYTMMKASKDIYTGDIQIRYKFLTGENADYNGMAKAYREYLVENELIAQNGNEKEAPIFLEMSGAVDKSLLFFGFPYDGTIAMTKFSEASEILADLKKNGVNNAKVIYTGTINGGINQRAVESITVESVLGGKSELKKLNERAEELGYSIYPNVLLQTAVTNKSLSKDELAITIGGDLATIPKFDIQTNEVDKTKYTQYIISPYYIEEYVSNFAKKYEKKIGTNLASSDFFTFIGADYKNDANLSGHSAVANYKNALASLANMNLVLSNPSIHAYPAVKYLTDIPVESSRLRVFDADVPFMQLVLSGNIVVSGRVSNDGTRTAIENVMRAMETKSALKYRIIASEVSELQETTADNIFNAEYDAVKKEIVTAYEMFEEYWEKVWDAEPVEHTYNSENQKLRKVEFSNGVKVLLNYDSEEGIIDGVTVPANNYVIVEGGAK